MFLSQHYQFDFLRRQIQMAKEDCAKLEEMLTIVSRELMPEVDIHEASMPE